MPELPGISQFVERAAALIRDTALNRKITEVESFPDEIVFSGISHEEFAKDVKGRTLVDVGRYGKVFYLKLAGEGRHPVLHFGMTGSIQIKGQEPLEYVRRTKRTSWPPRFLKFILHFEGTKDVPETALAFCDARRLGRIRLCNDPLKDPPISAMGFDPLINMPALDDFSSQVLKRRCPIKALLLDQSFSAGVGNWVADEILYHSHVHPEERCNSLNSKQVAELYHWTKQVCATAVGVNADSKKFPADWLFLHRWSKGAKTKESAKAGLLLPSGEKATIKFITVGGRTSAYVVELQRLGGTSDVAEKVGLFSPSLNES
ncbi:hypothetical protein SISSUDRAFT_977590 [Sistotremastrum suecicum HHB10207 ss-3]|uniref:Formamidopyrimidine-DNA glycosylase catalytic domain-containing protein n=1 Tax=Sistotremastrum suecicum HHB10207 ss-3 TaxID=1314776 RepID=A0A166IPU7_9AGAM|nr:hypothetical protein SISSUDRAFT_977590 [Sistotremastrum suecicum HHB10207 ss-3]